MDDELDGFVDGSATLAQDLGGFQHAGDHLPETGCRGSTLLDGLCCGDVLCGFFESSRSALFGIGLAHFSTRIRLEHDDLDELVAVCLDCRVDFLNDILGQAFTLGIDCVVVNGRDLLTNEVKKVLRKSPLGVVEGVAGIPDSLFGRDHPDLSGHRDGDVGAVLGFCHDGMPTGVFVALGALLFAFGFVVGFVFQEGFIRRQVLDLQIESLAHEHEQGDTEADAFLHDPAFRSPNELENHGSPLGDEDEEGRDQVADDEVGEHPDELHFVEMIDHGAPDGTPIFAELRAGGEDGAVPEGVPGDGSQGDAQD